MRPASMQVTLLLHTNIALRRFSCFVMAMRMAHAVLMRVFGPVLSKLVACSERRQPENGYKSSTSMALNEREQQGVNCLLVACSSGVR